MGCWEKVGAVGLMSGMWLQTLLWGMKRVKHMPMTESRIDFDWNQRAKCRAMSKVERRLGSGRKILATSAVILWHKALDLKQSYQHVQKKQENDLTENLKTTFVLPLSHSLPWHSVGRCDCWLGVAEILQIMHSHLGVQKNTSELVTQKTKRHKCNTSAQLENRMRLSHHTPAMQSWQVSTYKSVSKTLAKRELRLSNFRPPRN